MRNFGFWRFCSGVCCFFLISGCASRLPHTLGLNAPELDQAQLRWARLLEKSCTTAVDADVRLGWQAYGQQEVYPATLQAMAPGFLRFAVVDPLGRPVVLLVTDGAVFTLVDNRQGQGYVGLTDSMFIRKYLPAGMAAHDLFFWISGRVRSQGVQVLSIRKDEQRPLFWYEVDYGDRMTHLIGLGKEHVSRHLVLDEKGKIMVDVRYSNYADMQEEDYCAWPGRIKVSGKDSAVVFSLEFTRMYSFSSLQKKLFQVQFPKHFSVQRVH